MKDIALINVSDSFSRYPYLGIAYIASALEKKGFNVSIIDAAASNMKSADIVKSLINQKPRIIGISVMSTNLRRVYDLISKIKRTGIKATIVAGGSHITADPEIIKSMGISYAFSGECERTFPEFCEYFFNGKEKNIPSLKGFTGYIGGKYIANEPEWIENLDGLISPARHLLDMNSYFTPHSSGRITSMITSRGCVFDCIFCSGIDKGRVRYRSPENVVQELEEIKVKYNCVYVEFVDELFTLKREHVLGICKLIREHDISVSWGCGTRANMIHPELLSEMSSAGCSKITFGVESGNEKIRNDTLRKKVKDESYFEASRMCEKTGITPMFSFLFGNPGETKKNMLESVKFAKKLDPRVVYFSKTVALPSSSLFDKATREGLMGYDAWEQFMLGKRDLPLFIPKGLNDREVNKIYKYAYRAFYLRPVYVWRRLLELRNRDNIKNLISSIRVYIRTTRSRYK